MEKMRILKTLLLLFLFSGLRAQSWVEFPSTTNETLNDVFFLDSNHGWIVGDNGTFLKYTDKNWLNVNSSMSINFNSVFFLNNNDGWIVGDSGLICRVQNDSIIKYSSPTIETLNDIHMDNNTHGWIVGKNKTLLEYNNNTWNKVIIPMSSNVNDLLKVQFVDSVGIIVGKLNTWFKYINGVWLEDTNQTNMVDIISLDILSRTNIYMFQKDNWGGLGHIPSARLLDYNSNTDLFKSSIADYGISAIDFSDSSTGWAIGYKRIYKFNDDNSEFGLFQTVIENVKSIWFSVDSIGWIVGENGYILNYSKTNSNAMIFSSNEILLYPNPFYEKLELVTNFKEDEILLSIKDIFGNTLIIKRIYDNYTSIDLSSLEKGFYIVEIFSKNMIDVRKVIKR